MQPSKTQKMNMQQTLSSFKETVEEVRNKTLKQDKISVKGLNAAVGNQATGN